jgi:isoquinoline 1-oxidoreductase alpha subunit
MIQPGVNGTAQSFHGVPEMPLLWYLRDILGLTGSKFGCGIAFCTVHVNAQATRSCVTTMLGLS